MNNGVQNGDPMHTLLRVRRLTLDQARRGLTDCLATETVANERLRGIETRIAEETDVASRVDGDDAAVEAFAAWLRRMRQEREAAIHALLLTEAATLEARAVLAAAHGAVGAVEQLIEQQEAVRRAHAERTEQRALDEAAARARG